MRKKRDYKRTANPNIKYNSEKLEKMSNNLMYQGNKATIEKFLYAALERGAKALGIDPLDFFDRAVENVTLHFELFSRRVGGANYQVPKAVTPERAKNKAIKLLSSKIKEQKGCSLDEKILKVFMDSYNKTGPVFTAFNHLLGSIDANKVNAVYRW